MENHLISFSTISYFTIVFDKYGTMYTHVNKCKNDQIKEEKIIIKRKI
jgi:hypothetical protein